MDEYQDGGVPYVQVTRSLVFVSGASVELSKPPHGSARLVATDWLFGSAVLPSIHSSFAFSFVSPLVVHSFHFL